MKKQMSIRAYQRALHAARTEAASESAARENWMVQAVAAERDLKGAQAHAADLARQMMALRTEADDARKLRNVADGDKHEAQDRVKAQGEIIARQTEQLVAFCALLSLLTDSKLVVDARPDLSILADYLIKSATIK